MKKPNPSTSTLESWFQDASEILMNAPIGIYMSTPQGRYLYANLALARMCGYESPGELIESVTDIAAQVYVDPGDREDFIRLLETRSQVTNHQCRIRRRDGTVFWASRNAHAVRDGQGNITHYEGYTTDITEYKQIEESLKESEKKFREILTTIEDGYYEADLSGNITFCNQAIARMLGYSEHECIELNFRKVFRNPSAVLRTFKRVLKSGRPEQAVPFEVIRKDGALGFGELSITPVRSPDGQVVGFRGVARNITERKKAEEALRLSEEKYRELFENAPVGIFQSTSQGRYLSVNPEYALIAGYSSPSEMIARVTDIGTQLYVRPEDRERYREHLRQHGQAKNFEVELKRGNGESFWVSMNTTVKTGPEGEVVFSGFLMDISERKQMEEEIFQRLEYENLVSRISLKAVTAENLHEFLEKCITEIGQTVDVSHSFLYRYHQETDTVEKIHEWSALESVLETNGPNGLSSIMARWWVAKLKSDHVIHFRDIEEIPEEEIKNALRVQGIRSILSVPLITGGNFFGFIGFDDRSRNRLWPQEDVRVLRSISRIIAIVIERIQAEEELREMAVRDQLTGIYNRRGFLNLADQQFKWADRAKSPLVLFFADMDGLKRINDTLGHDEGDRAIIDVAAILKKTFRSSDIIARMGGDEFAVLAIDPRNKKFGTLIDRLKEQVEAHNNRTSRGYKLSISIGWSVYDPENPSSVEKLLADADAMMYEEKRDKNPREVCDSRSF